MRLSSLAAARPQYYDRNATSSTASVSGQVYAPHGNTTRNTTTIAAGKKLLVESIYLFNYRVTAAAVVGLSGFYVAVDGNVLATTNLTTNAVLDKSTNNLFGNCTVYAGSVITTQTYDLSTGGTIFYDGNWRGTQFDA